MNIQDYIRRNLPNMGISTYGDLLNGNKLSLESLSPEEKDNYNLLKELDKRKLLNEQANTVTNYQVSPMIRKGQQQNIGGIRGQFTQVM